jgi:hypothetical protein
VKGSLRENCLAREEGLGDSLRELDGPRVMNVGAVRERDQEARVGDSLHDEEKPFRVDRSRGPFAAPASRMKERVFALAFACSS